MTNTITPRTPALLALAFSFTIRDWLTPDQMAQVLATNAELRKKVDTGICATGDHCDSNMAMDEAFRMLGLEPFDKGDMEMRDETMTLWNSAWDIAKASDFFVPAHLREFPEMGPDLGFDMPAEWEDRSEAASCQCPVFALRVEPMDEKADLVPEYRLTVMQEELADPGCRYRLAFYPDARDPGYFVGAAVLETSDPAAMGIALALVTLREEVRDWQEALGGERDGLDGLCSYADSFVRPVGE